MPQGADAGAPVLGVDGWRGAWVAVRVGPGGEVTWRAGRFAAVLDAEVAVVGVDIPVGLLDGGRRACDLAGRAALGGVAAARLFPVPPRYAFEAPDLATANDLLRAAGEPGVSAQAYALRRAVLEVEAVADVDARVVEVHPELSFLAMTGRVPARKRTPGGAAERVVALGAWVDAAEALARRPPRVPVDDALDALAAAWTAARVRDGRAVSHPARPEQRDPRGRLLAIRA